MIEDIKTDGLFDPKKLTEFIIAYGAYGLCGVLNSQINRPQETPITAELLIKAGFVWENIYNGYLRNLLIPKGKKRHIFFICRMGKDKHSLELNIAYAMGDDRLPYNIEMECYPTTMEQIAVVWKLHTGKELEWGDAPAPASFDVVRGNVARDKEKDSKFVIRKPGTLDGSRYELVCESPHDDGDFSYLCTNEYCRCHS